MDYLCIQQNNDTAINNIIERSKMPFKVYLQNVVIDLIQILTELRNFQNKPQLKQF